MARPLRLYEPDGIYFFVTGRCLQARLLMRPSAATNAIIAGVLARAMARFAVDVFCFALPSNHFHMLIRSAAGQIPAFMQYFRSNVAALWANIPENDLRPLAVASERRSRKEGQPPLRGAGRR